jgi:hypothetical protein
VEKLYYKFTEDEMNVNPDFFISEYVEKGSPTTCPFQKANNAFVGGIKNFRRFMSESFFNQRNGVDTGFRFGSTYSTIKVCPGVNDLLKNVFLLKTPVDIFISVFGDGKTGEFIWNTPSEGSGVEVSSHLQEQFTNDSKDHNLFDSMMNIKFHLPLIFRATTESVFMQPMFHNKVDFTVVNGVYPTVPTPVNINTLIPVPNGQKDYFIPSGTVLSYIWFPQKTKLAFSSSVPRLHFLKNFYQKIK